MADELSEGQRALIEKIAEAKISEILNKQRFVKEADLQEKNSEHGVLTTALVERPEGSESDIKIPDAQMSAVIAKEAIDAWQGSRPPWWDVRKRLDTAVAGLGLIGMLLFGVVDYAWEQRALVANGIHWVADTDTKITTKVKEAVLDWEKGTRTSVTEALDTAFAKKLDDWSAGDNFSARSRAALEALAGDLTNNANPLHVFVREALEANPLLMFHENAILGSVLPVQVSNVGCEKLVGHWFENLPDNLPEHLANAHDASGLHEACKAVAEVRQAQSIEVPFFARFHKADQGQRDRVLVLLHIRRFVREVNAPQSESDAEAIRPSPKDGTLDGLSIQYNSTNAQLIAEGRDTVDISDLVPIQGNFFFAGFIDQKVAEATRLTSPGRPTTHELIHSVSITVSDDDMSASGSEPEQIQVRAMVMVNKEDL